MGKRCILAIFLNTDFQKPMKILRSRKHHIIYTFIYRNRLSSEMRLIKSARSEDDSTIKWYAFIWFYNYNISYFHIFYGNLYLTTAPLNYSRFTGKFSKFLKCFISFLFRPSFQKLSKSNKTYYDNDYIIKI